MRDAVQRPTPSIRPYHAVAAVLAVFVAGAVGSLVTLPVIPTWYRGLAKPWFTPPNGVFGPAWTALYLMMAYAFYRILGAPQRHEARTLAVAVFSLHMVLNALWSVAFFGGRSPGAGLADLALFWPVAIVNAVVFWRVDRTAGVLMVPNILWVTFAAALNIAIWQMN